MIDEIRVLVTDMDGTLLNDEKTLSQQTIETLIQAQKQGYTLVLATGRSIDMVMGYAHDLKMDQHGGYIVGFNGQQVLELATDTFYEGEHIDPALVKEVYRFSKRHQLQMILEHRNGFLIYTPWVLFPLKIYGFYVSLRHKKMQKRNQTYHIMSGYRIKPTIHVDQVTSIKQLDTQISKIGVNQYQSWLSKKQSKLRKYFDDLFTITKVAPYWIDMMPKGIDKAVGLRWVSQRLDIPLDHFMAFGDAENDISMIKAVRFGVAMSNAMDQTKEAASMTIPETNNEDGVAKTVRKIMEKSLVV